MDLLNHRFDFRQLFILEMANNHQGQLEHGLHIIDEVTRIVKKHGARAGIKLQFRELDTFVHPRARSGEVPNKHVKRFLDTRLTREEFARLVEAIRVQGLVTIATPFDEESVKLLKELKINVLKIGSCSAQDWPLLEVAANAQLPMIVSTGGLTISQTDDLVSFLQHRYVDFALMHCVAIYPTPPEGLQLEHIARLRRRYPGVQVGFSTHESPSNTSAIQMAYALGARLFERHVGVSTDDIKLNAYSSTPEQLDAWIAGYVEAAKSVGETEQRFIDPRELEDLLTLQRGVFARQLIPRGQVIKRDDVYFAFPIQSGQLASGRWAEGLTADQDYEPDAPLLASLRSSAPRHSQLVYRAVKDVCGLMHEYGVALAPGFTLELSHHYGMERFWEVGTTIITVVNREYCFKYLVQLPGQQHPTHHHRRKEEAFVVLRGDFFSELDGKQRRHYPGDTILVERGVPHRFWSEHGAIIVEVSTTHYKNDSVYEDRTIQGLPLEARKTLLSNWGRYHFEHEKMG